MKNTFRFSSIVWVTIFLLCSVSCLKNIVATEKDSGSKTQTKISIPKDVSEWKKEFISGLEKVDNAEGWALYSGGGFTGYGAGHIMVKTLDGGKTGKVQKVKTGASEVTEERSISGDKWKSFLEKIKKADSLKDLHNPGFDLYTYEYLRVKVKEGRGEVVKRLHMTGPDGKRNPRYVDVINAFLQL